MSLVEGIYIEIVLTNEHGPGSYFAGRFKGVWCGQWEGDSGPHCWGNLGDIKGKFIFLSFRSKGFRSAGLFLMRWWSSWSTILESCSSDLSPTFFSPLSCIINSIPHSAYMMPVIPKARLFWPDHWVRGGGWELLFRSLGLSTQELNL